MKNLLVAQSGGPSAVINATLAGIIEGAYGHVDKILGGRKPYIPDYSAGPVWVLMEIPVIEMVFLCHRIPAYRIEAVKAAFFY